MPRTPHLLAWPRQPLSGAIVLALMMSSLTAQAGTLVGSSATVNAGDLPETWTASAGSSLTINPGAEAFRVNVFDNSTLSIDGGQLRSDAPGNPGLQRVLQGNNNATVAIRNATLLGEASFSNGSTVTIADTTIRAVAPTFGSSAVTFSNANGAISRSTIFSDQVVGLALVNSTGNPSFVVTVTDSSITGMGLGAAAGGGTLILDNSVVMGTPGLANPNPARAGHGLQIVRGEVELRNGSRVTGAINGAYITPPAPSGAPFRPQLAIDASHVEGLAGAAVVVDGSQATVNADIGFSNGATATGGNGTLLEMIGDASANVVIDASTLVGNVVNSGSGATDIIARNNASLTGALTNVTSMALTDTARWNVTGDSTVGTLDLGSGTLAFAAPSPGYKTVTVAGDFAVNGGTLIFNSPLGDDTSPSDKLVVGGNTSGSGNIVVNNIGGAGAQTVEGIQLISVAGTSDAAFALSGRAVGGAYEYFLYKGGVSTPGDGGWYLRSSYTGDPCDLDPTLPACTPVGPGPGPGPDPDPNPDPGPGPVDPVDPVPVLRPEPGVYLANQAIATRMFQQRAHDRGERAFDGERAGAWVRVARDQVHGDVLGQIDARSQSNVVQIGSDLARWGTTSSGQIGVMLASGRADTQAVSNVTGYSTRGKVKGDAAGVYGTWVQRANENTGAYVDGWLQYARFDNDVQGEGLTKETYDATTRTASLEAGYSWALLSRERSAWFIQPQVQLTYTDYKGDTLQEANGTIVQDGRAGGLESRVGVRLFGHDNATGNRVQPFFAVNWLRGDHGNSLLFDGERISATLPTNRYEAQAGAQLKLGLKWSAWGDMRVQRGDGGYKEVAGQIGLRRAW